MNTVRNMLTSAKVAECNTQTLNVMNVDDVFVEITSAKHGNVIHKVRLTMMWMMFLAESEFLSLKMSSTRDRLAECG